MAAPPDVPVTVGDATLVEQSLRLPDVFAVLYDRYFDEIHRYLAGRLGTQAADDLAAETFLVAFRKRRTFDPGRGAVRPWLYGIATNLVAQHRRSETRRLAAFQRTPVDDRADHGHEDRVTARVTAASAQGRLASALERLSEGDRDVLLLIALADLSYEEVAQVLDIPFGTVGSRLNRARKKLRAALGGSNPMIGGSDG
ncbi:RNA polymerase sigma factor [Nonomuraea typhae]|uniref:RNA polymerase sigma factor n=1 Tax=Nonomuraea typhae TaxID=2603600 RepID=UPI0012FB91F0|nr:RNA polymerase sigma factor [Nonomuraea typhae]